MSSAAPLFDKSCELCEDLQKQMESSLGRRDGSVGAGKRMEHWPPSQDALDLFNFKALMQVIMTWSIVWWLVKSIYWYFTENLLANADGLGGSDGVLPPRQRSLGDGSLLATFCVCADARCLAAVIAF